jgi:hypothetical protein
MKTSRIGNVLRSAHREFTALGAWWLHEVREACVQLAERIRPGYSTRFMLELSAGAALLRSVGNAVPVTELHFARTEDGGLPPLSQVWPEGSPPAASVSVALAPEQVLLCELQLPPVRDADVANIIDLRLERELPLARDQVNVDWTSRQADGGQWRYADIAIAKRTDIERLRRELVSWNWRLAAIGMRSNDGSLRFNLLPPRVHAINLSMGRRDWRLLAAAAILSGAFLFATAGQWWYERSSLAAQLEQARTLLAKMEQQRSGIEEHSKPVVALRELMTVPAAPQVLASLSAALPLDSWIYEMQIHTPAATAALVEIEAYTPAATNLVDALERSPSFEQVQLVQATSAGVARAGADRVELTARLQKELAP